MLIAAACLAAILVGEELWQPTAKPTVYLADVLTRIVNGHPNSKIDDLLPWAYITAPETKAVA